MGLITCSECGKEISDRAASCPSCGNPLSAVRSGGSFLTRNLSCTSTLGIGCGGLLVVFFIMSLITGNRSSTDRSSTVDGSSNPPPAEGKGGESRPIPTPKLRQLYADAARAVFGKEPFPQLISRYEVSASGKVTLYVTDDWYAVQQYQRERLVTLAATAWRQATGEEHYLSFKDRVTGKDLAQWSPLTGTKLY